MNSIAPSLIHQESDIIKRSIRDMFDDETQNIMVEGNEGYQKAKNYMKLMMPKQLKKVKKYREKTPLFFKENIEKKLFEIYTSEVELNSGGYLVINPTEALVSIDVNSGKSIKQKNIESTALDTNLEAAEEIARQIKIRDLSGLIIIDFIDMLNFANRKQVERKIKEKCRNDRARIQIGRISNFGLLEMSRQRLRESNIKWSLKLTNESLALKIIKMIEIKTIENNAKIIEVQINNKISDFIDQNFKKDLSYFQKKNKVIINIKSNDKLDFSEYLIEYKSKSNKVIEKVEKLESLKKVVADKKNIKLNINPKKKLYKRKKYKKKFDLKKI